MLNKFIVCSRKIFINLYLTELALTPLSVEICKSLGNPINYPISSISLCTHMC